MKSFAPAVLARLIPPPRLVQIIRQIGEHKGREELFRSQAPEKLENLRRVAMVQSVESSNRIEGLTAPPARLREIVQEKTTPKNRAEYEIAGYRDVLNTIHSSASDIEISPNVVLQFHRDLMKLGSNPGGRWKNTANVIEETRPDGTRFVRFQPMEPYLTPEAMKELHVLFARALRDGEVEPLILIALYDLDFLCIHPFSDGNGRMARLLALLLLYHQGYGVGRYISLERLIEDTKETYYEALYHASKGWHEGTHDPMPWIQYWLGTVLAAYREFESRVGSLTTGHGTKTDIVLQAIDNIIGSFTISDLMAACPSVDRDWIKTILERLKKEDKLTVSGRGRYARWQKAQ